jgi:hypothetical protein
MCSGLHLMPSQLELDMDSRYASVRTRLLTPSPRRRRKKGTVTAPAMMAAAVIRVGTERRWRGGRPGRAFGWQPDGTGATRAPLRCMCFDWDWCDELVSRRLISQQNADGEIRRGDL